MSVLKVDTTELPASVPAQLSSCLSVSQICHPCKLSMLVQTNTSKMACFQIHDMKHEQQQQQHHSVF